MANAVPTISTTNYSTSGYVRLTWTNANKGVDWYAWRVYRRPVGGSWTLLKEYLYDQANYTFDDYTAPSNTALEYTVVRVYLNATVPTEEAKTASAPVTPVSENYWLIHPFDDTKHILLYNVVGDDFEDETEMEVLNIIGRGRKVDQGTNWGIRGKLSCQLRDKTGLTARTQLQNIRATKAAQTFFWLRNPWGDVTRVAIGDLGVDRLAGVGASREFVDIDFDYTQIVA